MALRAPLLVLFSFAVLVEPLLATHESGKYVPIMKDRAGASGLDLYSTRTQIKFDVLDCSSDLLLWKTSKTVAAIWNGVAPVKILLELKAEQCNSARFGNSISEIYWDQASVSDRPNTGVYTFNYDDESRVIIEEDIAPNMPLMISQAAKLSTSTTIVLYNAMMQNFGNALGLGNAYEKYPLDCQWSVMLANCTKQRLPPQEADLAAISHIYSRPVITGLQPGDFDLNQNRKIDSDELEQAIDFWTLGLISDELLMQIYGLWAAQSDIPRAAPASPASTSIQLIDLSGKVVITEPCSPHRPQRLATLLNKSALPNGVYLTLIQDCASGRAEIKKIVKIKTRH